MKTSPSKLNPDKIEITDIQIFKASLETSEEYLEQPTQVENFNVEIGHEIAHNMEDGMVRLRLFLAIKGMDESERQVAGLHISYGIEYHFKVGNLQDLIQVKSGDQRVIQLDLAATLFSIAYSTSRGIILGRTQGTLLGGVILPVVNPSKVMSEVLNVQP
jgi:hypothetical protein